MKKGFVKKRFMYNFVWISFLFIFLSNYFGSKGICLSQQRAEGQIRGTITDEEGTPIPGVTVEATSPVWGKATAITDVDGRFRLLNLPPGIYDIRAALPGFNVVERTGITVSYGGSVSLTICMNTADIDETGGIPQPSIQPVRPSDKTTRQPFNLPHLDIPQVTLHNNIGLNPFTRRRVPMNTAECYYSGGRIHGINGVARVGRSDERLNNITQIPYGDERYTNKSLKVELGCVYAIRVREKSELKTLLIRVLEVFGERIEIEYWIQNER
ncbi:MAG: carboxypeptidase-like regulatory domain-containing protein [Candidatus Aminicenantaceae bacterium]